MAQIKETVFNQHTGQVDVEYSDGSNSSYNLGEIASGSDYRWVDGTNIPNATQGVWVYPNVLTSASGNVTYIGFADTVSGGIGVAMLDNNSGKIQRKIVGYIAGELVDDHNVPSLIELVDGSLMVLYASHATVSKIFTVKMTGPDSLDIGERGEITTSQVCTYSQVFRIPSGPYEGNIALFYRRENDWCLRISVNEGRTWTSELITFAAAGKLYLRISQDPSDGTKLRVLAKLHPVTEATQNLWHCVMDWSVVGGKLTKDTGDIANSSFVGTPGAALPLNVTSMTVAWNNADSKPSIRLFDSRPNQAGLDAFLAVEFDDGGTSSNGRIYIYNQNPTGVWSRDNISPAGGPFFKASSWYYGGGCFSNTDNEVVYMTTRKTDGTEYYLDRMTRPTGGTLGDTIPWDSIRLVTSSNILSRPIHLPDGRVMYSEITRYDEFTDLDSTLKFVAG